MAIHRPAQAGTLESCDVLVQVEPAAEFALEIKSDAAAQFATILRATIEQTVRELGESALKLKVTDRGALDYTLRARLKTAIARAREEVRG